MSKYEMLDAFTHPMKVAERDIIGREKEIAEIHAALLRPELCNVLLLGEAGVGKTAIVQGTMKLAKDRGENRDYIEVDLARMISDLSDPNELAARLKKLFDETAEKCKEDGVEYVLFIDEFHQIVQLSAAAVEALKPLLADSGSRGIRVIVATTYKEFREYISPNQPLVERLQRINILEPSKEIVVSILKGMAKRYGVENLIFGDSLFNLIYEYTNRYIPANAQPRKSILILDAMIGWHRATGAMLDKRLLAKVIYESEGVNIAFSVDPLTIEQRLNEHVIAQQLATSTIARRLQIAVAGINDSTRPMSSFLFCGSTGVGKGLVNDTVVPVYTKDGSVCEKRNGDLQIGDYVFNREGKPVKVVGVFPRGMQDIYEVTLSDNRVIYTDSSHLWTYLYMKGKDTANTYTNSTKEIYDRGVYIEDPKTGKHKLKYWIPMNQAVQYPERKLSVDPYVMGVFLGDGCLTLSQLTLSSSDKDIVNRVSELIGNCSPKKYHNRNFSWVFSLDVPDGMHKVIQTKTLFKNYLDVLVTAEKKHIPKDYMYASVEQRWQLIKGLFDTDGSIGDFDGGRYNVSYSSTSLDLIKDIQQVLYSLGVASTYSISRRAENSNGNYVQYRLNVKSSNENKDRFFWLPRKVDIANKAKIKALKETNSKKKDYTWVGIADIKKMDYQKETTCIYVDDEEHLYQAGQYIVTHNTEVTKQLAQILFEDQRRLIRFDMTEYANPDSLERFRNELTSRVWEKPYTIVLLDEIEKACAEVSRLLLQVLDDGRLIDENNREVSFINAYIILTTNAGSEIFKDISRYNSSDTGNGEVMKDYMALIKDSVAHTTGDNKFPVELLGRIDCIVPFQPLSQATMCTICRMKIKKIVTQLKEKFGVRLRIQEKVVEYLINNDLSDDSDAGGARSISHRIDDELLSEIAAFINSHPNVMNIGVRVIGDMASEDKYSRVGNAKIQVTEIRNK